MDQAPTPVPPAAPVPAVFSPAPGGFWLRGGALMIDSLILSIVGAVIFWAAPGGLSGPGRLLMSIAYFTLLPVIWKGQTLGKTAAGLAVVRQDGSPLGYGSTFLRWVGYMVGALLLGLGFLAAAFTEGKRGLHDYIAGTQVMQIEEIGLGRKIAVIACGLFLPLLAFAGIVAALAIPQIANLQKRAGDGAAKGRLGMIRATTAIYYGDHDGKYPEDLGVLKEAAAGPDVPEHRGASGVENYGAEVCTGTKGYSQDIDGTKLRDTGKWGYVADPKAVCYGSVFIDCTHPDTKGKNWYSY